MEPVVQQRSKEEGNTISSSYPRKSPSKHWFWTIIAIDHDWKKIYDLLVPMCKSFVFQLEKGATGYEHWQGTMVLLKKDRLQHIKTWLGQEAHLEPTRSRAKAEEYCQKTETRLAGPWVMGMKAPLRIIDTLYEWQAAAIEPLSGIAHDRHVYWWWNKKGGLGRSALAKWICAHYGNKALVVGGAERDILHACTEMKDTLEIVIWNNCLDDPDVSCRTIEKLKDGLWFSGKYETGMVCINPLHVIVFSNRLPPVDKLMPDRWIIREIG